MTVRRGLRTLLAVLALAALLLASCRDGDGAPAPSESTPSATATPAATRASATAPATASPTPTATSTPGPEVAAGAERAFEHVLVLAVEIGERVAGTGAEREAAAYIASQFEAAGYTVALEEFDVQFRISEAAVSVEGEGEPIAGLPLGASMSGEASGPLIFAGLGDSADFADVDVEGAIVLLDRGVLTFADKARNAEDAGAVGVVVINGNPGDLLGTLGPGARVSIPVMGVAGRFGQALRALAEGHGEVTLRSLASSEDRTSQNVVARSGDAECHAYLGAHYDSIRGPGANDNASGTALLIELARTARAEGIDDGLCFIAFGAEEIGLFGSHAFVQARDLSGAAFMLNFDMVARIGERAGDGPRFIEGDAALADLGAAVAAELGYGIPRGSFPPNASSDHASFAEAGVPAITVHSGGAEFIHTPQDTIETVFVQDLAIFLEVSIALLERLVEGRLR